MIVYRVFKEDEYLDIIKNNSLECIGKYMKKSNNSTYDYIDNVKYLHFFKDYEAIAFLKGGLNKNTYIAYYDIPNYILDKNQSVGIYYNYLSDLEIIKLNEYAIPTSEIKYEYLIRIDKILENVEIEDFYFQECKDKIVTIYYNKLDGNKNFEKLKSLSIN